MSAWPKVKLGDVLNATERGENVDAGKEYRLLGVRLDGQGPFLRETLMGTQTAATRLFRVAAGDFIYSRLFACRGAFGVIESELDGCYVSGEFPTFTPVAEKLDVRYLKYWFRLPSVISRVDEDCTGSTPLTRNRFKEQFFVALEISLPPLAEQRRVVACIEELTAQIHEIRTLRQKISEELSALLRAIIRSGITTPTPMRELMTLRPPEVMVQQNETYQFAGVYSFGRGVFKGTLKSGADFAYPKLSKLRTGDFVYPKLMAWEGAFGITPAECDGCVVSTEFPVFEVNRARVKPEVLDVYFRDPSVWEGVAGGSIGTNARRRRLNPTALLEYKFPLPSAAAQESLTKVCAELHELQRLQAETSAELDALLPAILDRAFKGELLPRQSVEVASIRSAPVKVTTAQHSRGFVRAVLAAEVVSRLHHERTFGQVKFQKALFLAEYAAQVLEIESQARRFQNGPHDPDLIREVEAEMKRQEWFESYPRSDDQPGLAYRALERAEEPVRYFEQFWPEKAAAIRRTIDVLLKWDTERCERLATVYAAWNDLLIWNRPVTDAAILDEVLGRWHPAKEKIPRAKWQETIDWARENDFSPKGFGAATGELPQPELF